MFEKITSLFVTSAGRTWYRYSMIRAHTQKRICFSIHDAIVEAKVYFTSDSIIEQSLDYVDDFFISIWDFMIFLSILKFKIIQEIGKCSNSISRLEKCFFLVEWNFIWNCKYKSKRGALIQYSTERLQYYA